MITHAHLIGLSAEGTQPITKRVEIKGESAHQISLEVAGDASGLLVAFAADVSQLKSLFLLSSQPLTVKTNSNGSPANTITLAADRPFRWYVGESTLRDTAGTAITTDITALYLTNDSDPNAAATFQLFALLDPTV